jgi:hypothetical protein
LASHSSAVAFGEKRVSRLKPLDLILGDIARIGKNAVRLRRVGPFASLTHTETKEQLGGILVLETRDLNHAIQLISQHPGVKYGPWEIRPAADLTEMMKESEQRRRKHTAK